MYARSEEYDEEEGGVWCRRGIRDVIVEYDEEEGGVWSCRIGIRDVIVEYDGEEE